MESALLKPAGETRELACLELDITHMESLRNLLIGLPLKWRGGTGSPIRAVAVFED